MVEVDWSATARYGRIQPRPGEPTDAEKAEIERLHTRQDELVNMDEDDLTDDLVAEGEAIEARLEEIDAEIDGRATFRREDFAIAGCIATVGRDGALQVVQGLVKPEDLPKEAGAKANGHDADAGNDGGGETAPSTRVDGPAVTTPVAPPADPRAKAREEAGVGIGLADDLRAIRTALVKAHLAQDFEATFDLTLFQMARAVFAGGYRADALDVAVKETADRPVVRMNDDSFAAWSPGEAMLADRSGLSLDWMGMDGDGESFAALRALPPAEKQALFAAAAARTVKGQLAFEADARPELEATVARLGIEFAKHVRPSADMLWSRLRKDRILDIARSTLGPAWASARSKYRKADLAKAMEDAFASGTPPVGLGKTEHAAALAWTPPGFRAFDRGRGDDGGNGIAAEPEPAPADEPEAGEPEGSTGRPVDGNGRAAPANGSASTDQGDPAPAERPRTVSVVESIESPAAAERLAQARAMRDGLDLNAVPTADGSPRAVVRAEGFDGSDPGRNGAAAPDDAPPAPPAGGNGHDSPPRTRSGTDPDGDPGLPAPLLSRRPSPSNAPRRPSADGALPFQPARETTDMHHASATPARVRARVHDGAIARVTRFFNATLADIFTELLQNARRAGARRLDVTTERIAKHGGADIRVADDGDGIADPAVLLSFGETGWAGAARREDPAGMGVYALARRGCIVSLRPRRAVGEPRTRLARRADAGPLPRRGSRRSGPGRRRSVPPRRRRLLHRLRDPGGDRGGAHGRGAALSAARDLRRGSRRAPRLPRQRRPCGALAGRGLRRLPGPPRRLPRARPQLPRRDGPRPPAPCRGRGRRALVGARRRRRLPRARTGPAGAQGGGRDPVPGRDARSRSARRLPRHGGRRPGAARRLDRPQARRRGRHRSARAAGRTPPLAARHRRHRRLARGAAPSRPSARTLPDIWIESGHVRDRAWSWPSTPIPRTPRRSTAPPSGRGSPAACSREIRASRATVGTTRSPGCATSAPTST